MGSIPKVRKIVSEEKLLIFLTLINFSQQWIENVDKTHLVQDSGKPVLQKRFFSATL